MISWLGDIAFALMTRTRFPHVRPGAQPVRGVTVSPRAQVDYAVRAARKFGLPAPERVEILVNLDDDRDDLEALLEERFGFDLRLNSPHADDDNLFIVSVPRDEAPGVISEIAAVEGVETVEVNNMMEAFKRATFNSTPNDPLHMFQWNLDQVNAHEAWKHATGKGVVVAVIDTGVSYETPRYDVTWRGVNIPDLASTNIVTGYDFVEDDERAYDRHGHGTHVAGTIAQSTGNDYGVAGIAFDAQIMPVRVLDDKGRGNFSDVADAVRFAADSGADVINLSLGSSIPSAEVEDAIQYAHDRGVVVVAAAGNEGTSSPSYPAAYENVIAVAATQVDKETAFYSNYGKYIDIAAPGGNVFKDQNKDGFPDGILQQTLAHTKEGRTVLEPAFALYMGTSMAAPHVAGAIALLIEQGVTKPERAEALLKESARHPHGKDWDEHYGAGIVDIGAAVERATHDDEP